MATTHYYFYKSQKQTSFSDKSINHFFQVLLTYALSFSCYHSCIFRAFGMLLNKDLRLAIFDPLEYSFNFTKFFHYLPIKFQKYQEQTQESTNTDLWVTLGWSKNWEPLCRAYSAQHLSSSIKWKQNILTHSHSSQLIRSESERPATWIVVVCFVIIVIFLFCEFHTFLVFFQSQKNYKRDDVKSEQIKEFIS